MISPTQPLRCQVCDHTVELVDRYCARCGHDLSAGFVPLIDAETEAAEAGTPEASGGPTRGIAVGVAAVLVILSVAFGVVAWLTGSDEPAPEPARPTSGPSSGDDAGETGETGATEEPGVAQPGPTRRTEIRPGPTPEPPMLGEESGFTVVVRAEEGIVVVDMDTGERVKIDEPAMDRDAPVASSTMALLGPELWVVTADGLRAFDLRDDLVEIVPGSTAASAAPGAAGVISDEVTRFVTPVPVDTPGLVVFMSDGTHFRRAGDGAALVQFLRPPGFEIFGTHPAGIILTHQQIGGVWLLGDAEPSRISAAYPLAVSVAGVLVLDCDDDLTCSFDVVDVETGETVRSVAADARPTLPEPGTVSLLAPDGSTWVLAGQGTTEEALDLDTGGRIPGLVTGIVTAAAFSPDSRWLFLAGDAADRALLTGVPVDFSLPQRTIVTDVDLGSAVEVLVFERPTVS